MRTRRPNWQRILLPAVVLLLGVAPLLLIASVIAVRAWQPLSVADKALLGVCAVALVATAITVHRVKVRDDLLRSMLLQPPMAVCLYAFTHDPIAPVIYMASGLTIAGLIRWYRSRR